MNKIMKYGFLALFVLAIMSSCMDKNARKNNYPAPNITPPPVGTVYTIEDLINVWINAGSPSDYANADIFKNEDCSVYGIVTADETSGNLYKASFIQDRASGKAIELYMNSVTGLRIGDSVRVCLKGATLGVYRGTPQIQNIESNKVVVLDNFKYIEPTVTTIANIESQQHLCQLIRLENVQFDHPEGLVWAEKEVGSTSNYCNRTLNQYDENGNKIGSIIVRTSTYASFADKLLPQGRGWLNAIATVYQTGSQTWQLVIRGIAPTEVSMDGQRCE
jgi:hypothetical protein